MWRSGLHTFVADKLPEEVLSLFVYFGENRHVARGPILLAEWRGSSVGPRLQVLSPWTHVEEFRYEQNSVRVWSFDYSA